MSSHLSTVDVASIAIYLAGLAAVTIWVNVKIGGADSEHYFLGGRSVPFWAIGASLFASNLGTDHLVGLAGSGAASGLAVGNYEWSATYTLVLLGWVFVPHYLAHQIFTVPEYLEKRFSRRLRVTFTWLTILSTVLTKISVTIFSGAIVMKEVLDWNMWVSSVVLLLLTAVYTTIGGLAAVVYTEVLQSAVLIVGCSAVLWYGLAQVGGFRGLHQRLPDDYFTLIKPLDDPHYPWLGVLVGMPINSLWYWCTDQVMVQRVLAAKNVQVSQQACVLAGWLKILPMYLMVLPGLVAAALYPQEIKESSNKAFALLVTKLLPHGWQGPMIAVMLSSFMAALASCFNSCSTLFTIDVYRDLVPDASELRLVRVGRVFTVLMAAVSLAWLPVIQGSSSQLFLYIQEMQVIWAAPVVVVFLASLASDKVSEFTAWWALWLGLVFSFVVWLVRQFAAGCTMLPLCPIVNLNVLHFTVALFAIDVLLLLVLHFVVEPRYLLERTESLPLVASQPQPAAPADMKTSSGRVAQSCAAALVSTVVFLTVWHSV
mmetsp:Transcript_74587/g.230535  ORF Transcript_74587/g.230535 Transcript_74587/m.230535 type:complete len:542 (-) Transcript_74587:109-1734(-)